MYNEHRAAQFARYNEVRDYLISHPEVLISLEEYFAANIKQLLEESLASIVADYNEASFLYPFWQNYPPDERGRAPRGDQYPWIEVGEHAIGDKLPRLLSARYQVRDAGLPTGPDKRFVVSSPELLELTGGLTDSVWLFIDIKSVGPRDDFDHTVMSHNQVSGNGLWTDPAKGMSNTIIIAVGKNATHEFHCSIPPLYVLSDGTVAPVVLLALKPVYKMLALEAPAGRVGQPLRKITVVAIPNGLLLQENPGYLQQLPGLFYPGKDDKGKNPLKVRSRISFPLLRRIAAWRVADVLVE